MKKVKNNHPIYIKDYRHTDASKLLAIKRLTDSEIREWLNNLDESIENEELFIFELQVAIEAYCGVKAERNRLKDKNTEKKNNTLLELELLVKYLSQTIELAFNNPLLIDSQGGEKHYKMIKELKENLTVIQQVKSKEFNEVNINLKSINKNLTNKEFSSEDLKVELTTLTSRYKEKYQNLKEIRLQFLRQLARLYIRHTGRKSLDRTKEEEFKSEKGAFKKLVIVCHKATSEGSYESTIKTLIPQIINEYPRHKK